MVLRLGKFPRSQTCFAVRGLRSKRSATCGPERKTMQVHVPVWCKFPHVEGLDSTGRDMMSSIAWEKKRNLLKRFLRTNLLLERKASWQFVSNCRFWWKYATEKKIQNASFPLGFMSRTTILSCHVTCGCTYVGHAARRVFFFVSVAL